MSLVGPRPELPILVEQYEPWQRQRFAVHKDYWLVQVNGRSDKPMHLHTEDDIYLCYQHYSIILDIKDKNSHQEVETTRRSPSSTECQAARISRPSPSCIVRTGRAPPSTSSNYLSEVSPEWKTKVGVNTSVQWPRGHRGTEQRRRRQTTSPTPKRVRRATSKYAYALQNKLTHTKMINRAVRPSSRRRCLPAAAANCRLELRSPATA